MTDNISVLDKVSVNMFDDEYHAEKLIHSQIVSNCKNHTTIQSQVQVV